ncbi:thiamine pyrophosphate-dependent enzyme [Myxococcota bacterium]|nr:thiamine pyrophosphate-dependent enzyme [Myxococcota bacterium]
MTSHLLRVLSDDGTAVSGAEALPPLERVLALRSLALLAGATDAWLASMHSQGRIGFHVPAGGSGPALAAAGASLAPGDWLVAGAREWPCLLGRGVTPEELFHQARGDARDPQLGHASPLHLGDHERGILPCGGPVGARIPQASGIAHAIRIRGAGQAVLCAFGEATTDENDFHVGLNFAGVFRTPVVFLVHVPAEGGPFRTTATVAEKGDAYGIPGARVDGDDVLAVAAEVARHLDRARSGGGPSLLEVVVTGGDAAPRLDRYARAAGGGPLPGPEVFESRVRAAWAAAEEAPPPSPETLLRGVWAAG